MLPYGIFFAIFFYLLFFLSFFSCRWTLKVSWGHQALCHGGRRECKTQFQASPGSLWSQLGGSWGPWLKGDRQRQSGRGMVKQKSSRSTEQFPKTLLQAQDPPAQCASRKGHHEEHVVAFEWPRGAMAGLENQQNQAIPQGVMLGLWVFPRIYSPARAQRAAGRACARMFTHIKLSQTRLFWIYKTKRRKSESANWGAIEAVLGVLEDW